MIAIFRKLMAKKSADRFRSAAEVVPALAPFTKSSAVAQSNSVAPGQEGRTIPDPSLPMTTLLAPSAGSRNREILEFGSSGDGSLTTSATKRPARRLRIAAAMAGLVVLAGITIKITN